MKDLFALLYKVFPSKHFQNNVSRIILYMLLFVLYCYFSLIQPITVSLLVFDSCIYTGNWTLSELTFPQQLFPQ